MKSCTVAPTDNTPEAPQATHITNNNTVNNNNTNCHNTINTTNNTLNNNVTINIILYDDQALEFHEEQLEPAQEKKRLKLLMHPQANAVTAIVGYGEILMKDKRNRCVRKKHLTNSYCEVKTKSGWRYKPDKKVITRLSQDIAGCLNDRLFNYPNIGPQHVRDEITNLASCEDEVEKNKQLKMEVRSLVIQTTKNPEET